MKKIVFVTVIMIFYFANTFAQERCDLINLPQKEKEDLNKFWTNLRHAILSKNSDKLSELYVLPFNCSFCTPNLSSKPYVVINRKNIKKYQDKLFYSSYFIEVLSQKEILDILYGDLQVNGECTLNFSFPIRKPSSKAEGRQGFYSLKKINGSYRIVSAWAVP